MPKKKVQASGVHFSQLPENVQARILTWLNHENLMRMLAVDKTSKKLAMNRLREINNEMRATAALQRQHSGLKVAPTMANRYKNYPTLAKEERAVYDYIEKNPSYGRRLYAHIVADTRRYTRNAKRQIEFVEIEFKAVGIGNPRIRAHVYTKASNGHRSVAQLQYTFSSYGSPVKYSDVDLRGGDVIPVNGNRILGHLPHLLLPSGHLVRAT